MSQHAFGANTFRRGGAGEHPRILNIVDPSAVPPVTLDEAKEWLRVDGTDQDGTIDTLILAATEWAEGYTRRAFVDREIETTFGSFPAINVDAYLPKPPVGNITAITYVDSDGTAQVFDESTVTIEKLTGLARVNPDEPDWPQGVFSCEFVYTAGYGPTGGSVPEEIKTAILIATAQMFEVRVDQTFGAQASKPQTKASMILLQHHRVWNL